MLYRIYHQYFPPVLFILIGAWGALLWRSPIHPPIGTYIAGSAFLAIIVTIWPPESVLSKSMWIAVFLGLTLFEVNNLYWDREKHDSEQAQARSNEAKAFQQIADGLATSMKEDREAFDVTMFSMRGLAALSGENLKTVTGGNSFCYLDILDGAMPIVVHVGKYPLYGVTVRIVDLNNFRKRAEQEPLTLSAFSGITISIGDLAPGRAWVGQTTRIPLGDPIKPDFNVFFSAKNGSWTDLLRMRKVNGQWERATRVEVDTISNGKATPKIVFEQISKAFPVEELAKDGDWKSKPIPKRASQ